jgi:hypothetical protein
MRTRDTRVIDVRVAHINTGVTSRRCPGLTCSRPNLTVGHVRHAYRGGLGLVIPLLIVACTGSGSSARHRSVPSVVPTDSRIVGTVPPFQPLPGTPPRVARVARSLARAMAPHPPARATWVRSTWRAWENLQGQVLDYQQAKYPDAAIYVVEVSSSKSVRCLTCKGLHPISGTTFASAFPIGRGRPEESLVTKHPLRLYRLGPVHVAFRAL